jgi:hypothetical protein
LVIFGFQKKKTKKSFIDLIRQIKNLSRQKNTLLFSFGSTKSLAGQNINRFREIKIAKKNLFAQYLPEPLQFLAYPP